MGPQTELKVLAEHFPDLAENQLTRVRPGLWHGNGYFFRLVDGSADWPTITRALHKISRHLPGQVPVPVLSPDGRVFSYPALPGTPRAPGTYSEPQIRQLAHLVRTLHHVPSEQASKFDRGLKAGWQRIEDEVLPRISAAAANAARETMQALLSLRDPCADVVCHGDLTSPNILVEGEHIAGLIDFEDLSVADPAWDLRWLPRTLGQERFERIFLPNYADDDVAGLHHRTVIYSRLTPLEDALESLEERDFEAFQAALGRADAFIPFATSNSDRS